MLITTESNIDEYAVKFPVLEEFCNLDGEFQVGGTIVKITEDNIVCIVDPIATDPSEVDNETVTDSTEGVLVRAIYLGACCPLADNEVNQYTNNPRRRLTTEYNVADISVVTEDPFRPGRLLFLPVIEANANSRSQIRRIIIVIGYWACLNNTLTQNFGITFSHNADNWGINDPVVINDQDGPNTGVCRREFIGGSAGGSWSVHWWQVPPVFNICVEEVDLICSNATPATPVTVEIHCD